MYNRTFLGELDRSYLLFEKIKRLFDKTKYESEHLLVLDSADSETRVSFSVISHGNEVGGLAALNQFMEDLLATGKKPAVSLTFALGNIEAGKLGQRYLEKDLDRCFGGTTDFFEDKIAREYETWLSLSHFNLDVHQTVEPAKQAFFVGPDNSEIQHLASLLCEQIPMLAFPMGGFSKDGTPLDEYLIQKNIPSLSVELGQKGFCESQIEFGKNLMHRFLFLCTQNFSQIKSPLQKKIFRRKAALLNSPQKDALLKRGINNLSLVKKGEFLGESSCGPIICPEAGYAVFPKYGELAKLSSEICQIVG